MKTDIETYGCPLRIYDNGGETFDRYTIIPPDSAHLYRERGESFACIGASSNPYHPLGFGQWTTADPGEHLGERIHWQELPEPVRQFARECFPKFCPSIAHDVA